MCQKSYTQSSALSNHNKTAAHVKRMKSKITNIHLTQSSFVDCGESIKIENIKEEMNEEESVDDPLSIQGQINSDVSENIVTEVKEDDDPLFVQEIHNSEDKENNTVSDDIDIVEHKIETDIYLPFMI